MSASNYNSLPWLNPKNVRAHFPESKETQNNHMQTLLQGLQSTKRKVPDGVVVVPSKQNKKMQDIFTHVYNLNDGMQATINNIH